MFELLHRHRTAFFVVNGLFIAGFALPGLIAPDAFWGWLGVPVTQPMFVRLAVWYLLSLGVGALLVVRDPDRNVPMIWILGLEKAGAVTILLTSLGMHLRPQLMIVGIADTILSPVLLYYAFEASRRTRAA